MNYLVSGPKSKKDVVLILAHGAGAPMDSDWMNVVAEQIGAAKIKVVRFEFPYMEERRVSGKKRPPNTMKVLKETWLNVINDFRDHKKVFIGGKSMGGRVASLICDEAGVNGFVGLGFPFHAPGKDPGERIVHLASIKTKGLIVQGDRDSFGTKEEVKTYSLSKKIKVVWLPDGDHSFKPRKKSGHTLEENINEAVSAVVKFVA